MVWVMSNKNMKEVFFCCKYNWLFFPFNVGLNNLFPLWRSVAFVILLFGDRTKIGPTWKGYWIKSQICHRFIYHRHLPPIFSDCLSQLMPVTEFFLPHQSASIQLWEYIYMIVHGNWIVPGQLYLNIGCSIVRPVFTSFCRQWKGF